MKIKTHYRGPSTAEVNKEKNTDQDKNQKQWLALL